MKNFWIFSLFIFTISSDLLATDGTLDATFGTGGKVLTDINLAYNYGYAMVVQSDGKIIVGGQTSNGATNNGFFCLVRYNSDGSLDQTFGSSGKVITSVGNNAEIHSLALTSDGKIVAGGIVYTGNDYEFAIARYTSAGVLDNTFDTDGKLVTSFGSGYDVLHTVLVQNDDKIIASGISGAQFTAMRFNTDGSLDNSFDSDGIVSTAVGSNAEAWGAALQKDGKIVLAGQTGTYGYNTAVVRYKTDGSLDSTFDSDGIVNTNFGDGRTGHCVAIQDDGKIVVGGTAPTTPSPSYTYSVIRYNSDGSLDLSFNSVGYVSVSIGGAFQDLEAIALQADGKIILAGYSVGSSDDDFMIGRLHPDGTLDLTFNYSGKVKTTISNKGTGNDKAYALAVQSDGNILVAGYSDNTNHFDFSVVRYNSSVDVTSVNEIKEKNFSAQAFPNPFTTSSLIQFKESTNNAQVELYNAFGQKVQTWYNVSGQNFLLQRESLAEGVYFLQVRETNDSIIKMKIVISD